MFFASFPVLLGCLFIVQVHGDFFEHHVKNFLNHSVSPCDDFFRHVCAYPKMQPNDFMIEYGNYLDKKWLAEMEEEHWKQTPPTKAEKILRAMKSSNAVFEMIMNMDDPDNIEKYSPGLFYYFTILWMSREKMHILEHPEQKNIVMENEIVRELFSLAGEEIEQSTDRFNKEQIAKFRSTLEQVIYEMGGTRNSEDYRETVQAFERLWEKTEELSDVNETNIAEKFPKVLEVFKKHEDVLYSAVRWNYYGWNIVKSSRDPWYSGSFAGESVFFTDPVLAVTVNTSIPTLYGYFAHTVGHEIFHSYQRKENFDDEALGKSARCIADHMNKTCDTYSEGFRCWSGQDTFSEDGPDVEGIQLAYKLFVKRIGDKLKMKFSDTGFTNEQMFFYSVSTSHCSPKERLQNLYVNAQGQEEYDVHSAPFVRSNANLSLMKAFHEAFQCKPGDRMYDLAVGTEDCNTFGAPVRK